MILVTAIRLFKINGQVWVFQKLLSYWQSHTTPRVETKMVWKTKYHPMSSSVGINALLMRRMTRLVQAARKSNTESHMTNADNCGEQKNPLRMHNCETMSYTCRRPRQVQLLWAKNRNQKLHWARVHQNWTAEGWKHVTWSDESLVQLQHANSMDRTSQVCVIPQLLLKLMGKCLKTYK